MLFKTLLLSRSRDGSGRARHFDYHPCSNPSAGAVPRGKCSGHRTREVRRVRGIQPVGHAPVPEVNGLDLPAISARLSAKPQIRVERGTFVVQVQDDEYFLGSTREGLTVAIRRMRNLRRANRA